ILRGRHGRQGRTVLVAVLWIRRKENDAQANRLLAFEIVLEVAIFVPRFRVDEQNFKLFLADIDRSLDTVIFRLELARLGIDLEGVDELAGLFRPVPELDSLDLSVGWNGDPNALDLART